MARDKKRIKAILKEIEVLWNTVPDQRFYQLLFNYTSLGRRGKESGTILDPFHIEDDLLLAELTAVNGGEYEK